MVKIRKSSIDEMRFHRADARVLWDNLSVGEHPWGDNIVCIHQHTLASGQRAFFISIGFAQAATGISILYMP
jgi:hypothetical protein